jgi:hypothetical protein
MHGETGRLAARLALVGALLAGALTLWLSASGPGHASTASQTQGLTATVQPTISWGSAGGCTQSMGVADFGSVTPGVAAYSAGFDFKGCVTSSAPFGATVVGTAPLTNSGGATIPFSSLFIYQQTNNWSNPSMCTGIETCPLDTSRTILSAEAPSTKQFNYNYGLKPPTTQAPGAYTGGVVTFTATN